jgi:outer membrane translocation and assembly module TamA
MLAVAVFVVLNCSNAVADEKTYDVSALAIRATKSNSEVSPELKPIVADLKKQFKYTGFKLESKKNASIKEGKPLSANLLAGYKVQVTPLAREDKRIKLKIEISKREGKKEKRLARTTVTITSGRYQLLGGWRIDAKSQDVLITAVSAK